MATLLYWPGKYFFYPIGNTPAVSLTRDIPPDVPADILLLPCGDPRNVLYTIFSEPQSMYRKLDFTCCDHDPGVLARDVLLLTMIVDNVPQACLWDIFFHMYLGDASLASLVSQCSKLLATSADLQDWDASWYGRTIRIGSEHTLLELRRLWTAYHESCSLSNGSKQSSMRDTLDQGRETVLRKYHRGSGTTSYPSLRSCGPLLLNAMRVQPNYFINFWETGTTLFNSNELVALSHPNPTFLHSRRGEGFHVHYGTDPLSPFHLAPSLQTPAEESQTAIEMVKYAQAEFQDWCDAFRVRAALNDNTLAVRFLLGDALAIARTLLHQRSNTVQPIPVTPWTSHPLELSSLEYHDHHAPTTFDVIDTSNLSDHLGLLNMLTVTIPLLSAAFPWTGVLYTVTLLSHRSDPAAQFAFLLAGIDISAFSVLMGVCPVNNISGFTTICNTNELLMNLAQESFGLSGLQQSHQIIAWRQPGACDPEASVSGSSSSNKPPALVLDSKQLAAVLYKIYRQFFEVEDPRYILNVNHEHPAAEITIMNLPRYTRESFVIVLRFLLVQQRLPQQQWQEVMGLFIKQVEQAAMSQYPFDRANLQDFSAQLHRYGIYTYPALLDQRRASGRFSSWTCIPPLVRVFLSVPPKRAAVLNELGKDMTPILQGVIRANAFENAFISVNACFGTVDHTGTDAAPRVTLREAEGGLQVTDAPLVVSWVVPTWMFTNNPLASDDSGDLIVELAVRSTPGTASTIMRVLGLHPSIFAASLSNTSLVHIVPEECLPPPAPSASSPAHPSDDGRTSIGIQASVSATLDPEAASVAALTARLDVRHADARRALSGGAMPSIVQTSPCVVRVTVGEVMQDVVFPLPIEGGQHKARLARKSSYIEIVVPMAMPFPKRWALKTNPFPIVRADNAILPCNIHRVHLDRSPLVNIGSPKTVFDWLNPHVGSQMTGRERALRAQHVTTDILTLVKDTIHSIIVRFTGIQGDCPRSRVFALRDDATADSDTIFFMDCLRFDLAAHAVVCDGYVLALSEPLMRSVEPYLKAVLGAGIENVRVYGDEMRAWKQLLPALVERCRTTWRHCPTCEYASQGRIPLEVRLSEGDPLCSCGRGKDVGGMRTVKGWRPLAPFVTRIALSPIFPVAYLEPIFGKNDIGVEVRKALADVKSSTGSSVQQTRHDLRLPDAVGHCERCKKASECLRRCSRCKRVAYCTEGCQKADWKRHKASCTVAN